MPRKKTNLPVEPGRRYRLHYGGGHPYNGIIHVIALFDYGERVLYKQHIHGGVWNYRVERMYWFQIRKRDGILIDKGPTPPAMLCTIISDKTMQVEHFVEEANNQQPLQLEVLEL